MNNDNQNFLLTISLCLAVLLGWNYFFEQPKTPIPVATHSSAPAAGVNGDALSMKANLRTSMTREESIAQDTRVWIKTDKISGSIRLRGARLDDLTLSQYRETTDAKAANVTILSPELSKNGYYVDLGWLSTQMNIALPSEQTVWSCSDKFLEVGKPVKLTWDNGSGLRFTRTIAIDADYVFTFVDRVDNQTNQTLPLQPYGLIRRHGLPPTSDYVALHEGIVGYLEGALQELKYKDLQEKSRTDFHSNGGWFGFTDKYWLTALIPDQQQKTAVNFRHVKQADEQKFQTDYMAPVEQLNPGAHRTYTIHVFSGPKELKLLDAYETKLSVEHFDLAVDFGWFYFITKPLFYFLSTLQKALGNLGLAILALTVLLKMAFLPLANKSYHSMARMKKLQPMMESLKEKYGDDKVRFNQELMSLYKKEKVNPASGCLPMVVQIPFFFALYKVLFISIEMRHAPFWGWIHDLSAPDPTTLFNVFGLIPWDPPSFLMIGIWPLIMGISMVLQQRMNPTPADPIQAKMFMIMPVMFTYMLAQFPVGLVIYWAWNNILTIAQQWYIMNRSQEPAAKKVSR